MKNRSSLAATFGLVLLWATLLCILPAFLSQFADFKVEMPALTMATLTGIRTMGGIGLPVLVLLTALLLSYRQIVGWALALSLCVAYDLAILGLLLPLISLINNLSGGDNLTSPSPTNAINTPLVILLVGAFLLNQVLFVWLLTRRHSFIEQTRLDGNGKISYT